MGQMTSPVCRACGHMWTGELIGGVMLAGVYRCDRCGASERVSVDQLTTERLRRKGPWSLSRVEARNILGDCRCGGTFDANAPIRCPECGNIDVDPYGNPDGPILMVD